MVFQGGEYMAYFIRHEIEFINHRKVIKNAFNVSNSIRTRGRDFLFTRVKHNLWANFPRKLRWSRRAT